MPPERVTLPDGEREADWTALPAVQVGSTNGDHEATLAASPRTRVAPTVVAALGLAILTNGPSIALSHRYNVPLGWERWPYILPMGATALVAVFLVGRDLSYEQVRKSRVPLACLAAYLLWSFASVMWSVAPDATAVRCLVTTGVSALGVWYALCLRFREQLMALFLATTALTLWSLALILLQPHTHQIYPPPQYPQWHTAVFGVFGNPNSLGPVAALSALSAIGIWIAFPSWHVRAAAACAAPIGVILTLWSQCLTAVAGLFLGFLAIAGIFALPIVRRLPGWSVGATLVLSAIALWNIFFHNIARIAPALGESVTLSSRRLIWRDVRSLIALRPWRGYGFFAFWDNQALTASTYAHLGSSYGSAHNSILEVALGLGRIGLVIYISMAVVMLIATSRALWARTSLTTVTWVVMALFLVVQNSMESFVLWHSYLWALFVAAMLAPSLPHANPSSPISLSSSQVPGADIGQTLEKSRSPRDEMFADDHGI